LEESGDYALARNIYSALLKIGAKLAEAHAGLASTFEKEGLFEQSIRHYREAIAYASELSFYQSLAALQIRTGDDKEAAKTLIHALGLGNIDEATRFELHKSLGNCFTRSGDYGKAEHHYARAYEYQPKSDTLQVNVGSLALQKNDISAALEHFQKAIELNPNNDKAICGVGMVHLSNGDIERAYDYFLAAVRSQPSNITALFNLAKCALDLRKYSDAAEALENYMKNSAPNVGILFSYAGILFHKGDIANASKEVERILKINASHAGAIELRDIIARRNKNE
ncbi:MAG TPA: tetratricopeptide repeat protein, partial [Oligoflexia bacterium]|nr:tetratricopeptide repeat protein [Oligoflexia bacterium]